MELRRRHFMDLFHESHFGLKTKNITEQTATKTGNNDSTLE